MYEVFSNADAVEADVVSYVDYAVSLGTIGDLDVGSNTLGVGAGHFLSGFYRMFSRMTIAASDDKWKTVWKKSF